MTANERRVAFIIESLGIGGAERVVCNLATAFDRDGWTVDVVVTREGGPLETELSDSVTVRCLSAERTLASIPGLVSYFRTQHPDAVVANTTHVNVVATLALWLSRVDASLVVVEHSQLSDRIARHGRKEWATAKLAGVVYPWADGVVSVSDGLGDDVAASTGLDRSTITTIHNPIVTEDIEERAVEPVDHPWFAGGPPVLLSVGRLEARKDIGTLLSAFNRLRDRRKCRLIICGDGPERDRFEALVTDIGIQDQVDFVGWVDNPYAHMARADVFVLSSVVEGLPTVLIEALSVGCPVVTTDCGGGAREILESGRWGRLVPVGDAEALTTAIEETLNKSPDGEALQGRAKDFGTDRAYQEYVRIVRDDQ